MNAVKPASPDLTHLKYETITSNNIGVDFGLFSDKVNFTFELYKKVTDDLLQKKMKVPSSQDFPLLLGITPVRFRIKVGSLILTLQLLKRKIGVLILDLIYHKIRMKFWNYPKIKMMNYIHSEIKTMHTV